MEYLSLASFLANGHPYHLYVYDDVKHIPAGTIVEDANAVLPASMIFKYRDFDSYAGFSNYFRYKLLLERGGWWVDTDVVCLRPFDFEDDYVFASQISSCGAEEIANAVIKAPPGSPLMEFAWKTCLSKDPQEIQWGETGPFLMREAVAKFQLEHFRKPYVTFCPVSFQRWRSVLEADTGAALPGDAYALHLWNEMWRRAGQSKNGVYATSSLYEQLKHRYEL
jgi:mannosyltransferase OCH1-like enzyme